MAVMTYSEWKKQAEKDSYSGLYVFYGEEAYCIGLGVKKITDKVCSGGIREFNLSSFDDEVSLDELENISYTFPMMAEKRCVVVKDFKVWQKSADDTDKLLKIAETLPESTVLILYYTEENKKDEKWKSFIKKCEKLGTCISCDKYSDSDLEKLLVTFASKRGCELSRRNAGILIRLTGNDMRLLLNETEKLCAFTEHGEITYETIKLIASQNMETTVFIMAKNLVSGDIDKAFEALDVLLKQNEKLISVLSVLSSNYVDMYRVKAAMISGYDEMYPAKAFSYKLNFKLSAAAKSCRGMSIEAIRRSLKLISDAEIKMKNSPAELHRMIMERLFVDLVNEKTGV